MHIPDIVIANIQLNIICPSKTPEDGFEPPSEDPESSVLPLDDSGIK